MVTDQVTDCKGWRNQAKDRGARAEIALIHEVMQQALLAHSTQRWNDTPQGLETSRVQMRAELQNVAAE